MATTYSLTSRLWPKDGVVELEDPSGTRILGISIEFMTKGGVYNWDYVSYSVACCVEEEGTIRNCDGTQIDHTVPPAATTYHFMRTGKYSFNCICTLYVNGGLYVLHKMAQAQHAHPQRALGYSTHVAVRTLNLKQAR